MKRDAAKKIDEAIGTVLGADVALLMPPVAMKTVRHKNPRTARTSLKLWNLSPISPSIASAERARFTGSAKTCGKGDTLLLSTASASQETSMLIARKRAR